jgi:hypothetical protein
MENACRGSEIPDYPIFLANLRIGTLGASPRSRWEQLTNRSSVVQRVLRFARQSGIDVHVINRYGESAPSATAEAPEDGGE